MSNPSGYSQCANQKAVRPIESPQGPPPDRSCHQYCTTYSLEDLASDRPYAPTVAGHSSSRRPVRFGHCVLIPTTTNEQ